MPRHAAPKRPPGGKRAGRAEVSRRLALVADRLAVGDTLEVIAAKLRLPARTVDDYARRVRERWQAAAAVTLPEARARALARLSRLAQRLERERAWPSLVAVERLRCDVEGVRAPLAVEVQAPEEWKAETVEDATEEILGATRAIAWAAEKGSEPLTDALRHTARVLAGAVAAADARAACQ